MTAAEFEIGKAMIEIILVEPDDTGVAATVIAVTGFTILVRRVAMFAVEATVVSDVGGDRFVTVEAQLFLRRIAQAHVAARTLRLELGMARNHFSRHQEFFDFEGACLVATREGQ